AAEVRISGTRRGRPGRVPSSTTSGPSWNGRTCSTTVAGPRPGFPGGSTMHEHDTLYIGGEWVKPAGTGTIEVVSPHTEEVIGRVPDGTNDDIDRAVAA